jgi:hypothetical protein
MSFDLTAAAKWAALIISAIWAFWSWLDARARTRLLQDIQVLERLKATGDHEGGAAILRAHIAERVETLYKDKPLKRRSRMDWAENPFLLGGALYAVGTAWRVLGHMERPPATAIQGIGFGILVYGVAVGTNRVMERGFHALWERLRR